MGHKNKLVVIVEKLLRRRAVAVLDAPAIGGGLRGCG